jgi:hypothetical protein
MKCTWLLALMIACAAAPTAMAQVAASSDVRAAAPAVVPVKGQVLHTTDGGRLAQVENVLADGSVQIIYYGRLVTVPASSLSMSGGELTTSMTKNQIIAFH